MHILLGTTEGTATERAKKQKKRHTSKEYGKGAKANTRDSLTVGWFSSTARASKTQTEALDRSHRMVQLNRYSSTSSTSSTRGCSYLDTAPGSSPRTWYILLVPSLSWKIFLKNLKNVLIIQTHELGDSYGKGAIQRDRLIDRRLTTAAAAKEDYAASHRYSSSSPRRCS